jgi:hypothetical protein
MTDKDLKFTTAGDVVNPPTYKLEDGTEYKADDYIKVETREHHQTTHYLNREIAVSDIIEEFGDLPTFEKGLYFDYNNYQNASDEDKELADRVQDFVREHDYERHEDLWTDRKGGYDVDDEIVKEFTMKNSQI